MARDFITVNIEVDRDALPDCVQQMPSIILDEMVDEVETIGQEFVAKLREIQSRYEKRARDEIGRNVIPFRR